MSSPFWKPGTEKPRILEDEEGGVVFFSPSLASSSSGYGYASIEKQRQRLPVYKYRTSILYLVETHATTIIVGETGSGKTTQIPQYLKEAGWADGGRVIACTQPRRLAVQAVASRVAEEMGVKVGEEVGYTIRFEDLTNKGVTMIKFLTDGVLLREMMDDPLLTKYSVIMVDEAHERSISTDILLGLLKKIQRRRPELRLIISSATIEAKSMSAFFQASCDAWIYVFIGSIQLSHGLAVNLKGGALRKSRHRMEGEGLPRMEPAILSVEGRGFNVQIHYVEEPIPDYVQAVVSTVMLINDQEPPGDILVFLTGQDDIDAAVQLLTEEACTNRKNSLGLIILPLYSGLPRADQELVFSPTPRGKRKVVISTNIAETSLTLEGVVYVVDSGFSKQRFYNPELDLVMQTISCLCNLGFPTVTQKLYTEEYFVNEMPAEGIPEMQRSNLVSCVIQLKALGIDNILGFDWPAPPPPEAMIRAVEVLYSLGVIDDDAKLTSPTGFQVAEIPLDPMISKMILSSSELGCSEEIITIAAILSIQVNLLLRCSIWVSSRGAQRELDEARLRFAAAEKKVIEIREQLRRIALRIGMVLKSCDSDMQVLRKAVCAGFFANACRLEASSQSGLYKTVRGSQEIYIHPSSVLFSKKVNVIAGSGERTSGPEVFEVLKLVLMMIYHGSSSSSSHSNLISDGLVQATIKSPIQELDDDLGATSVTCEPIYGFLPCTTELWGQLFLVVVYEYLLSLSEQYISSGSNLFFEMFGTGVFGASLFHVLAIFPQLILVLGDSETVETIATMGMALLAGSTIFSLTITWGSVVAFGNYDLSLSQDTSSTSSNSDTNKNKPFTLTGFASLVTCYGVETDAETKYTARIMLVSMIPFLLLQLAKVIHSSTGTRVIVLVSLIITLVFLITYWTYQKKLLRSLLTSDNRPNISLIEVLFRKIDKNKDTYISNDELRALILGIQIEGVGLDEDDFDAKVMEVFDISGDSHINENEFVTGLTEWLTNQHKFFHRNSKKTSEENKKNESWWNYVKAGFLVSLGTAVTVLLTQPLMESLQELSTAVNIPSFFVSYVVIPLALSSRQALKTVTSARQKTENAASLTFSEIYGGVFMNNLMGLVIFLMLVYIRNISWDVSAEVLIVLIICTAMGVFASFSTKFPFWTSIVAYLLAFAAMAALEGVIKIKTGQLLELSVQQIVDCDRGSYGCKRGFIHTDFEYVIENAVIALEDVIKIKTGQLLELSVQQLVYCDGGSYGCKSGFIRTAFKYAIENGIAIGSSYPYKGREGKCDQRKATNLLSQSKAINE
ncbi:hypothetical protein EZV62_026811 [Acer yangbiense]|uniref:RNA helicase n=2 Tax=Magnoliopsida TaxID=3398 RepID=A0A5C7GSR2_9ROSI|nr:hypothetical protein EZV62_026811 [Acer yangbiense]